MLTDLSYTGAGEHKRHYLWRSMPRYTGGN